MQRVAPKIGGAFIPVEQALREAFIPVLLQGLGERTLGRGFTLLTLKHAGLAFPDLTKTARDNCTESFVITGHLVADLRGKEDFRTADHSAYLQEGIEEVRKRRILRSEEDLVETLAGAPVQDARQLQRVAKMEACLTVQPSMINVT